MVVQAQGFFRVQQTCRACGGRGAVIASPCQECSGSGRVLARRSLEVSVPPGVDTGTRIRLSGEGEAGAQRAPRGDLYCLIRVREHAFFQRDGNNLICRVPITFSQAALGGDIEIPSIDGAFTYTIKAGVQSGDVLRVTGKGMPIRGAGGRRGDLHVVLLVETPKNLSKRQEELLRELAELDHKNVSPQRKTFFDKLRGLFGGDADGKDKK